jgi:E3 ubiquitin-protein ligase CCNP1IP1
MACSHVFCIDCSNSCQLSGQREGLRPICPACDMHLTNPDDVVVTNLNPTEDYKTSVLSGLSPNVIMECAGRALGFWAYQTTQEMSAGPALT